MHDLLPEAQRLDTEEARIIGCLIEKEATTPEQYPLTQNALQLACNQKTSRDPIMELQAGQVGHALRRMEERRLVRSVHGSRAQRYEHRFAEFFGVTRAQQAVLAVLMLRGPQTAPELLQRSDRLHNYSGLNEVQHTLDRLIQHHPALVVRIPRSGGQREDRFMHLLCGEVDIEALRQSAPSGSRSTVVGRDELLDRIATLEARIETLESRFQNH